MRGRKMSDRYRAHKMFRVKGLDIELTKCLGFRV
jgi:hypothetical protein